MGSLCCSEGTDEERNHLVDSDIRSDRSFNKQIKKLLLLGPGSSGKTTFFKQLKLIHTQQGFTKKERRHYQAQIENQIIEQMQKLIVRGREFIEDDQKQYSNLEIASDAQDSAHYIEHLRSDSTLNHL